MNVHKKVLVVDDEQDVRVYLKTALLDAGFTVETAVDGSDALEKVQEFKPDLISLDLVMPKHSGIKFYHTIQKDKELRSTPILIVTGHARDELGKADFDEMTMQGPGIYLEKPVKPATYVGTICKMLNIDIPNMEVEKEDETLYLKKELAAKLDGADPEALKKALDALNKSK